MPVYNAWTVEYKNGSTWTAINNVQDLSCSVGRQTAVDQWPVSTAEIRIRYPNGYNTPLANLTQNTPIRFFAPGRSSTKPSWTGYVKDMAIEIGIPWTTATSTGQSDFLVLSCQGAAAIARRQGRIDVGTPPQTFCTVPNVVDPWAQRYKVAAQADPAWRWSDVKWSNGFSIGATFVVIQQDISNLIDAIATYTLARVVDGVKNTWSGTHVPLDDPGIYFGSPVSSVATVGFSDTINNATNRKYDQIDFDSLMDNTVNAAYLEWPYYFVDTIASVFREGSWDVQIDNGTKPLSPFQGQYPRTVTGSETTPTKSTWSLPAYFATAEYWSNAFWPADIGISSISATTNGQHTQNLDTLGVTDLELGYLPLYVVPVTLRGQTFYCQIEGVQVTADTNQARFTYYVTPTGTAGWFTLDSAALGVLDQNRLGIY